MTRITAHFDGRAIVPDEPVDLSLGEKLIVDIHSASEPRRPRGISGQEMLALVRQINWPKEDLAEMKKAIEEDCEQIDHDEW